MKDSGDVFEDKERKRRNTKEKEVFGCRIERCGGGKSRKEWKGDQGLVFVEGGL
jgi:hypothetical protein